MIHFQNDISGGVWRERASLRSLAQRDRATLILPLPLGEGWGEGLRPEPSLSTTNLARRPPRRSSTPLTLPSPPKRGRGCWSASTEEPRRDRRELFIFGLLTLLVLTTTAANSQAQQDQTTGMLARVGFDQNLDAQVPLDLPFRDELGNSVRIGDYLGKKPAILTLVYYQCPMLCNEVLNSLLRSLNALSFDVGKQFDIITVSIDPKEPARLAAQKKAHYIARYGRKGAAEGWHFLTGDQAAIAQLAKVAGFRYVYDAQTGQFAHPAGIMLLTRQGKLSRYLYGVSFPARDIQLGLMDASMRKIGSPIDQLLLLCYHYDPRTGKYNFAIMSVIRLLGIATIASMGTFMLVMLRRDWRKAEA
jgi:protein SCO1/2